MKPLRERIVDNLSAEVRSRGLSHDEIALVCGFQTTRTVARLLGGETFSIETAERVEAALQIEADDCSCHASGEGRRRSADSGSPIIGWEVAALELRVPERTLRDQRRRVGDRHGAWWESGEALRIWYRGLLASRGTRGRPLSLGRGKGAPR